MFQRKGPGPEAIGPDHHRNIQGGAIRAAIFGISDGLVTNVSLILGVAGASADPGTIRLAGLAGLVAGAFSMAAGEYVSMAAQRELIEHEIELERESLDRDPKNEQRELVNLYRARGISRQTAEQISEEVMRTPESALAMHALEELGVNSKSLGSPLAAASSSLFAFALGAVIPLLPWFFISGNNAVGLSIGLGASVALLIGGGIGLSTGRPPWRSAIRQLAIGTLAGGVTYGAGALLGARVS